MKINHRAQEAHEVSISDLLTAAGFDTLPKHPPIDAVETVLSKLVSLLSGADDLRIQCAREEEIRRLNALGLSSPAKLVDAALTFKPTSHDDTPNTVTLSDPDPWPQPVDGAALLDELLHWLQSYLFLPRGAAEANALWAIATWCVDIVHFAPILAVLSATKRCGKSYLLDLLRYIVRRGHWTSALGATPATIFRLNDSDKPTFLIDEAEKLGGRNPSTELIHLLNQGYRRGGKVTRCIEHSKGHKIVQFDAFGFRALAAIGDLADTLIDRAIIVRLERKPKTLELTRFNARTIELEGKTLARRIRRWVDDNIRQLEQALDHALRPKWLNDRACDNWAPLLAVATVAGGPWPERALAAAAVLSAHGDDGDRNEQLIHDIRRVFKSHSTPEMLQSGNLVEELNKLEASPWADWNRGKGITANGLAAKLRPFAVRPRQGRTTGGKGANKRGYWYADLEPIFDRYPEGNTESTPQELLQLLQPLQSSDQADSDSADPPEENPDDERNVTTETPVTGAEESSAESDLGNPPEPDVVDRTCVRCGRVPLHRQGQTCYWCREREGKV